MRTQHPLFGFSTLGDAWDVVSAGTRFLDDYRDALLRLSERRDELPAPVYFQVPASAADDERWQRIIGRSEPQCGCPARRLLLPTRGRSRFVPHAVPLRVAVTTRREVPYTDSLQAAIIPHGGDLAAAHLTFGMVDGWATCNELPLMQVRPEQQSVTFNGAAPRYDQGRMRLGDDLYNLLRRRGEVFIYRTLYESGGWRKVFPVCSIVDTAEGEDGNGFVIELDASVTHQIIDPYSMPELHVCQA